MVGSVVRVAVSALVLLGALAARADYEVGQRAWEAGRPDEALAQWQAAAGSGDRRAMHALGRLYLQGLGVLQDYVEAHKWLNLAASRGEAAAVAERDALAEKMTPAQVAEAQALARAWRPTGTAAPGTGGAPREASPAPVVPAGAPRADEASETTPAVGPPPPRAIREAQRLLAALGYEPGAADGEWGERTGQAYRTFLGDAGLAPAEMLTPETLHALREVARRHRSDGRPADGATEADAEPAPRTAKAPSRDALPRAVQAGDIDGVKAALAAGADPNARDGQGWTALMYAANRGYPLIAAPLLAAGAEPDIRAPDGATALFIAALHGHAEVVSLLLDAGADGSIKGPKGRTAMEMAELGGYREVAALLEANAAERAAREKAEAERKAREEAERLDREAFARAKSSDTVQAYVEYRSSHPNGKYREAAQARLEELMAAANARAKAGETLLRDCDECPELAVVPAGEFLMGSPDSEKGRFSEEGPVHRVTIGEPFAVGVYEVTFEEWDACVRGGGCGGHRPYDERWGRGDRPVINVSWTDARSYVEWLSRRTGKRYRLLSESEWEYVARAGTRTPFHFGEVISTERANYDGRYTYGPGRTGPYRQKTVPVGSFPPNGFGLHEVHGNVSEWVQDCWNRSYERAPADGSAGETRRCAYRGLRGGSWLNQPRFLRSAFRTRFLAGERRSIFGFRVARALASTEPVQEPKSSQRGASSRPQGQEAASPTPELVEETSTPTRTLPSDAGADQAAADSRESAATSSPAAELAEETSTPTRDPVPGASPTPPREFRTGDVVKDCASCPELVVVPAGEFLMGSPDSERGRFSGEGPVHRVTLGEPFAVGVHEVTFEEWDACVREGGCGAYRPRDEGWGRGRRPVIDVSWDDARSYVEWLSRETGERYRLLSESEWEYVARAGTQTPFHFGEAISPGQANYDGNHTYGPGRKGPFRKKTVPVGSFSPNRFGLHDVHGNVWEWVQDCRSASYQRPPADGGARETRGCSDRVARGGSWNDLPAYLRSAFRNAYQAGVRRSVIGFRVARALGSTEPVQGPKSTQRGASSTPPGPEPASPDAEVAEETSTPTRDPTPDAGPAAPRTDRKGEVFQDCAHCPEMVVVLEGEFLMGSPSAEGGRWEDEAPRHRVTVPGPFAVGRYEVTFAEYDACHRDGGCSHAPRDEGWGRGNRPLIHVSWKDAREYVDWLSEKTGRRYRLLSESEWEYAARAGTDSSYYWGEEPGKGHANCSRCGSDWDGKSTSPAGSLAPNGFGVFDMLGNVWEWVEDCGHRNYEGAPTDGSAWVRRGDCRFRMLRGGSWEDAPSRVRSAFRHWEPADTRNDVIGFRVATTLR